MTGARLQWEAGLRGPTCTRGAGAWEGLYAPFHFAVNPELLQKESLLKGKAKRRRVLKGFTKRRGARGQPQHTGAEEQHLAVRRCLSEKGRTRRGWFPSPVCEGEDQEGMVPEPCQR